MKNVVDKVLKDKAKKTLSILDNHIQLFQDAIRAVNKLKDHAIEHNLHQRAIHSRTTLTGLDYLVEDIENGRAICMKTLGAKKIPIVMERKLKLVVNNEKGGN